MVFWAVADEDVIVFAFFGLQEKSKLSFEHKPPWQNKFAENHPGKQWCKGQSQNIRNKVKLAAYTHASNF